MVYAGRSPDTGKPVIHAYLNPLVKWIWFGGIVVVLGTGLAMLPNRRAAWFCGLWRKILGRRDRFRASLAAVKVGFASNGRAFDE